MSVIAAAIKHMLSAGMPHDAIVAAVADMEAAATPVRTARQERNKRYYDSQKRLKASEQDVSDVQDEPKGSLETKAPTPLKTLNPSKENPPKGGQKKGSRLSADWTASKADLAYAASQNISGVWLDREIEKFRNYWTAKGGATAVKRDWAATWRNWVLSAVERGPPHGQGPPSGRGSLTDAAIELQHQTRRHHDEPKPNIRLLA
jgi:hypothetical protein